MTNVAEYPFDCYIKVEFWSSIIQTCLGLCINDTFMLNPIPQGYEEDGFLTRLLLLSWTPVLNPENTLQ